MDRPSARRPGHCNHRRLRRLCCGVRLQYSNLRNHWRRGAARDEAIQIQSFFGDGLCCCRRYPRHPDPPSMGFVLYGLITEQSIGKLLISGILPGILLTLLFIIAISIWTKLDPTAGPCGPRSHWREKGMALKDVWAVLG